MTALGGSVPCVICGLLILHLTFVFFFSYKIFKTVQCHNLYLAIPSGGKPSVWNSSQMAKPLKATKMSLNGARNYTSNSMPAFWKQKGLTNACLFKQQNIVAHRCTKLHEQLKLKGKQKGCTNTCRAIYEMSPTASTIATVESHSVQERSVMSSRIRMHD